MEKTVGSQTYRRKAAKVPGAAKRTALEARENHNRARREKYASDPSYAERIKIKSKQYYATISPPKPTLLANGLLHKGIEKEIKLIEGNSKIITKEVYTVAAAATALNKNPMTINRWRTLGIFPEPIYMNAENSKPVYLMEELSVIAFVFEGHESNERQYTVKHTEVIQQVFDSVNRVRRGLLSPNRRSRNGT
jgi:hypothetical protein